MGPIPADKYRQMREDGTPFFPEPTEAEKAAQAAEAAEQERLENALEAAGVHPPRVRRRTGLTAHEFLDVFAAEKAAGLHDMKPSGEPDWCDQLGEEIEKHPLGTPPIIRGA